MEFITFRETADGLTPFENGRSLCAPRAREEAVKWVNHHSFRARHVVILGLGAGLHIIEWMKAHPQAMVTVIDTHAALVAPFLSRPDVDRQRLEVLTIDSFEGLLSHEVMEEIALEMPPVLAFQPAWGLRKELFQKFFGLLTARSAEGLRYFLARFGFHGAIEVSEDQRLLTIKDLGLVVDSTFAGDPRAPLIRMLRELVV